MSEGTNGDVSAGDTFDVAPLESAGVIRLRAWIAPAVALVVLALALGALHAQLHAYRYHDLTRAALATPRPRLGLAVALTAVAYMVLACYDALALSYVGRAISLRRTAFASVIASAFSQTLGFSVLTGGAVRYRLWTSWGLSAGETARAAAFVTLTFWLGLLAVGGVVLVREPPSPALAPYVPVHFLAPVGLVFVGIVGAYLVLNAARRAPLTIRGWELRVPGVPRALLQIGVSSLDWAVAAAAAYVLLPSAPGLTYPAFLGIFLLAQLVGVVSTVPGGLGVFETLVVLLLRGYMPAGVVLPALLVYRAVYYFLPFCVGVALLVAHEVQRRRHAAAAVVRATAQLAGRWWPAVLPNVLAASTFAGGMLLLFSGATPSVRPRVSLLDDILPLGLIELSHFAASVAGAGLLVLSWALRRRLDAAWALTLMLLGVGIVASMLKGLDWEEALALAIVFALVAPSHAAFSRRGVLMNESFEPGWIAAVVAVLGVTVWLGVFSFKHVDYAHELWWQFGTHRDAPRFLRATAGASVALLVFALARLLRHAEVAPSLPTADELARAAEIAARSHDTAAHLALLGDKSLLFAEAGTGMLMYGVERRSWIALGDPIGTPAEREELAWRLRGLAHEHGGWAVFYEVGTENLPLYIDLGLTLLKLGEEAVVDLAGFDPEAPGNKSLRRLRRDSLRQGATVRVVPPDAVAPLLPQLRAVSDAWLIDKRTREKGFSLGRFDERYLERFPVAVVWCGGEVVAFANLWLGADRAEASVDLMRYSPAAPRGVMDFLFLELMLWAKGEGYRAFNLGMAPLSGLDARALAPLWSRVGALVYRHAEHFYNFQGVRQYKAKFHPTWRPRYLAAPGGLVLPRVLTHVAALIGGGLKGVVSR